LVVTKRHSIPLPVPTIWDGHSAILEDRNIGIRTHDSVSQCLVLIDSVIEVLSQNIYRKSNIEKVLSLSDFFTWEELPTRDPDTGYLTKAGYSPIIQALAKILNAFLIVFNIIQFIVRSVTSHDMI
jgi:hypothetical protein